MKEPKNENSAADGSVESSDLFCECGNWCRDGRDMLSPHHPRCEHYQSPPDDPRYAIFGKLMWDMIRKIGDEFCWYEWSEDVLPLAHRAGLCRRVIYDPAIHGDGIDEEPGCEIWYWGDADLSQGDKPSPTDSAITEPTEKQQTE